MGRAVEARRLAREVETFWFKVKAIEGSPDPTLVVTFGTQLKVQADSDHLTAAGSPGGHGRRGRSAGVRGRRTGCR
jgi:hypothetical protein